MYKRFGKVSRVVGLMTESKGPGSSIGDLCYIHETSGRKIPAEVVGFHEHHVLLMPFSAMTHIAPGCLVEATGKPLEVYVGDALIGMVLDPLGQPLDGAPLPPGLKPVSVDRDPPNPLT
ncbi:flagellum-specific ATP synthase FliI, partial [Geobacillus stearothermophilus]|nr:flagellum-specific ATP synthase FliI [Geobacillus stearothermophilus]